MDVRDWANSHPKVIYAAVAVCVLASVGWVAAEMLSNRHTVPGILPPHYFTVDDGKSYFTAGGGNIPPFQYQGQTAVRAHVFESNGQRFVGYLERYKPDAQKAKIARTITPIQELDGREMKKPGDANWFSSSDHAALSKIVRVPPPSGSTAAPVPVEP